MTMPEPRRRGLTPVRWTNDTVLVPYNELPLAWQCQVVDDYRDTLAIHPGKAVIVEVGRTPTGQWARRVMVIKTGEPEEVTT